MFLNVTLYRDFYYKFWVYIFRRITPVIRCRFFSCDKVLVLGILKAFMLNEGLAFLVYLKKNRYAILKAGFSML